MFKEILVGAAFGVLFLVFLYFASQVQMKGWLSVIERFLTKKTENNEQEKEK